MSDKFDILKLGKPVEWNWEKRASLFPLKYFNQDNQFSNETEDIMLRRHHPVPDILITIRKVRYIAPLHNQEVESDEEYIPEIRVNGVRDYPPKSHTTTYWQDSGWERRNQFLIGHYRTANNKLYPGSVELFDSNYMPMRFYIYHPPRTLLKGAHGPCYRSEGNPSLQKYFIHFVTDPTDVDSGIIQIERNLSETVKLK